MADDPYIDYYNTGIGWGNLYGGTGASAGVDNSAYYMYGAPQGSGAYDQANAAYQSAGQKQATAQQLQQLISTPEGRRWLQQHSSERDQMAEILGYDREALYSVANNNFGTENLQKKLAGDSTQWASQYEQASKARDAAKAEMGPSPFETEVNRQMGLADDYRTQATDAQGRQAVQMDRTDFDADRTRELMARNGMLETESQLRDWTAGRGPSAAQTQFQSSLDQSINNQLGMANSARGGAAALASARNQAAQQGMQQRMQAVSAAGTLRAQEMQSAMQQLQNQGYNIRAQDQTRTAQGAQWADAQSRLSDAQKARNDMMTQYYGNQAGNYENMRQGAYARQAQMAQAKDQARQQDVWAQRSYRKGMEDDQFQRDTWLAKTIMGAAGGVAQGALAAGAGALTGGAAVPAMAAATVANSAASNFTGGGQAVSTQPYGFGTQQYGGATSAY